MGAGRGVSGVALVTLALSAFLMAFPVASGAAPFHLEVDHALLDLGSIKGVTAIDSTSLPPDPPATLDGTMDEAGRVVVPQSGFSFPPKTGELTSGIEGTVTLTANRDLTGQFDPATGDLTIAFDLKATVVALGQTCVINPIRASLSTAYGKPYLGVPFTAGTAGPGALSGSWEDLPAPTGGALCQVVGQLIVGPGGIWMAHGLAGSQKCVDDPAHPGCDNSNPCANGPSSACCLARPAFEPCHGPGGKPKLALTVVPRSKTVRPGGTLTLTARVRNTGTVPAGGVRVCMTGLKTRRGKGLGSACATGKVPAGGTLTRTFRVKLKRTALGRYLIAVRLTAAGLPARTAKVTVNVRR